MFKNLNMVKVKNLAKTTLTFCSHWF